MQGSMRHRREAWCEDIVAGMCCLSSPRLTVPSALPKSGGTAYQEEEVAEAKALREEKDQHIQKRGSTKCLKHGESGEMPQGVIMISGAH